MKGGLGAQFNGMYRRATSSFRGLLRTRSQGFTLIEVLIVLAVTGGLFVAAAVLISGKQNQTAFSQGIRELQSQIQQAINEVSIGYYPNLGNFNCTAVASGPSLTPAGGGQQGTNSGCIFIGKVIQFDVAGTDPEQFQTYTLAGLKQTGGGQEVSTYAEALPKVIAPSTTLPATPDVSTTDIMQSGITTYQMYYWDAAMTVKTNVSAVAFANSLSQYNGGTIISGTQKVNVIPILNTTLNSTPTVMAEAINANIAISVPNPSHGVSMCFVSGGTNQSGLITIGDNNRELSVKLDIKSNKTCS